MFVRLTCFFFFNDTATTEIYALSLHDALPICPRRAAHRQPRGPARRARAPGPAGARARHHPAGLHHPHHPGDRKSTRLNSSHANISYAVFCLKKTTPEPRLNPPILILSSLLSI